MEYLFYLTHTLLLHLLFYKLYTLFFCAIFFFKRLKTQNQQLRQENSELKKMLGSKAKIPAAKALDQKVNGGGGKML